MNRRDFLSTAAQLGVFCGCTGSWFNRLAMAQAKKMAGVKRCLLLWMPGAPSQFETFSPLPNHENGGGTKAISTSVPGIQISENLPLLAKQMHHLAIIRSMKTREGDHGRAAYEMRTGYRQSPVMQHPTLGSLVSQQLPPHKNDLPSYISLLTFRDFNTMAFGPGFLGPAYAPLIVGEGGLGAAADAELEIPNLAAPPQITGRQIQSRLSMLEQFDASFRKNRRDPLLQSHQSAQQSALKLMNSEAQKLFDASLEPETIREAYGRNRFGQACLIARRLLEAEVPFVEVSLFAAPGNAGQTWDSHVNNNETVASLCEVLDPAYAMLVQELVDRGMWDSTLVVWMGEFGRTPKYNEAEGRDHFPDAWSVVLGGAGITPGAVYGSVSADGSEVKENPVSVADLQHTILSALDLDPSGQNLSKMGRPIRLADPEGQAIKDLLI